MQDKLTMIDKIFLGEAPPPGAYDPKFDTKVKGFSIEKKSERFLDNRSIINSGTECNKSVSSRGIAPIPSTKFRTPQLQKQHTAKPVTGCYLKAKTKLVLNLKELKYDTCKELADTLREECANKNETIHENEKYINNIRFEIRELEEESSQSCHKWNDVEVHQKHDLATMANSQQDIFNTRDKKHNQELNSLREQLLKLPKGKEMENPKLLLVGKQLIANNSELTKKNRKLEDNFQKQSDKNDEMTKRMKQLESRAQLCQSEYIEKLDAMENEKKVIVCKWEESIAKNEKEIHDAYSEMRHLGKTLKEQNVKLKNSEERSNFFWSEYRRLLEENEDLNKVRCNLENAMESRLQVVLYLQFQLFSIQCEMEMLKAEHEKETHDSEKKIPSLIEEHVMMTNNLEREIDEEENENSENDDQVTNIVLTRKLQDFQIMYEDATNNYGEPSGNIDEVKEDANHQDARLVDCLTEKDVVQNCLAEQLHQQDAHLLKLSSDLNELRCNSATQERFCQSLQDELDRAEGELAETRRGLKDLKQQIREEAAEMVTRRRRFSVIMVNNQATVGALSLRLAEGNAEIERLENELKMSKELIKEHQDLLKALQKSSSIVNEQSHSLIGQMNGRKESIGQLEIHSIVDIESLRGLFERGLDEECHIIDQQSKTIERLQADGQKRLTCTKEKENFRMSPIPKSPFGTPVSSPHKPLTPLQERNG